MTTINFDYSKVKNKGMFVKLEEGNYDLKIIEETIASTGSGKKFLKIIFEIMDGTYIGGLCDSGFFIFESDEKSRNIAEQQLKRLGLACGILDRITDSAELIGKEVVGKAIMKKNGFVGFVSYSSIDYATRKECEAMPNYSPSINAHADLDDDLPF